MFDQQTPPGVGKGQLSQRQLHRSGQCHQFGLALAAGLAEDPLQVSLYGTRDVRESNAGTSAGRWEGRTLVVETVGFDSQWDVSEGGIAKVGKGARSIERISLKEPDVLQIELTLAIPELLEKPFEKTCLCRRDPEHEFIEYSYCRPDDRSLDPVTQTDRFDMTPPADLPPPPKE